MGRKDDGTAGIDNDFVEKSFENVGAWIMGRNMFGPVRGQWPDEEWKGWWGGRATLSCSGVRFNPSCKKTSDHERRNNVLFCY